MILKNACIVYVKLISEEIKNVKVQQICMLWEQICLEVVHMINLSKNIVNVI